MRNSFLLSLAATAVLLTAGALFASEKKSSPLRCVWSATWKNHSTKWEKTFPVSEKEGVRFGLQTDFICIVSPVAFLAGTDPEQPGKHMDMNCRYAEAERGMATGLAAIESERTNEVVRFFLVDQLSETSHSVTLRAQCGDNIKEPASSSSK